MQILKTNGPTAIVEFYITLTKTGQTHLAVCLEESEAVRTHIESMTEITNADDNELLANLRHENKRAAEQMFRNANKLSPSDRSLIIRFLAGNRSL